MGVEWEVEQLDSRPSIHEETAAALTKRSDIHFMGKGVFAQDNASRTEVIIPTVYDAIVDSNDTNAAGKGNVFSTIAAAIASPNAYTNVFVRSAADVSNITINTGDAITRLIGTSTLSANVPVSITCNKPGVTFDNLNFNGTQLIINGTRCTVFGCSFQGALPTRSGDLKQETGTSTATGATSLTDASKSWTASQWLGYTVVSGASTGVITANTATVLTIGAGWVGGTPATGAYTLTRCGGLTGPGTRLEFNNGTGGGVPGVGYALIDEEVFSYSAGGSATAGILSVNRVKEQFGTTVDIHLTGTDTKIYPLHWGHVEVNASDVKILGCIFLQCTNPHTNCIYITHLGSRTAIVESQFLLNTTWSIVLMSTFDQAAANTPKGVKFNSNILDGNQTYGELIQIGHDYQGLTGDEVRTGNYAGNVFKDFNGGAMRMYAASQIITGNFFDGGTKRDVQAAIDLPVGITNSLLRVTLPVSSGRNNYGIITGAGTTTMTDSTRLSTVGTRDQNQPQAPSISTSMWVPNQWIGSTVYAGASTGVVTANGAQSLTIGGGWTGGTPAAGSGYYIAMPWAGYSAGHGTFSAYDGRTEFGTSTALTTTLLTDSTKNWTTNQWSGRRMIIGTGVSAFGALISSNTATTITFSTSFTTFGPTNIVPGQAVPYRIFELYEEWSYGKTAQSEDFGTETAVSATTLTDSSKSWTTNQWKNQAVKTEDAVFETGTSTSTSATNLGDSTKAWTVNQWTGFTIRSGNARGKINFNNATALAVSWNNGVFPTSGLAYSITADVQGLHATGAVTHSGVSTGTSSTTLTDGGAAWTTNEHIGKVVCSNTSYGMVRSNTGTVLTISSWLRGTPSSGGTYKIVDHTRHQGTSTATSATTLTDTSQNWTANQWAGWTVVSNGSTGTVTSNTHNTITLTSWGFGTPASGNLYVFSMGQIGDLISDNADGTRPGTYRIQLPNPFTGTTSSATATTLTDTSKAWLRNEWVGCRVTVAGSVGTVTSNTATVLTVGSWSAGTPAEGSTYSVGTVLHWGFAAWTTDMWKGHQLIAANGSTATILGNSADALYLDRWQGTTPYFFWDFIIVGMVDSVSTATTATTLTDSTMAWVTNQWAGTVITSGASSATVVSNTGTVITVSAWTGGTPTPGAAYKIAPGWGIVRSNTGTVLTVDWDRGAPPGTGTGFYHIATTFKGALRAQNGTTAIAFPHLAQLTIDSQTCIYFVGTNSLGGFLGNAVSSNLITNTHTFINTAVTASPPSVSIQGNVTDSLTRLVAFARQTYTGQVQTLSSGTRLDARGTSAFAASITGTLTQVLTQSLAKEGTVTFTPQQGYELVDFGAFPGTSHATRAVTGLTLRPTSFIEVELAAVSTPDHSSDEHMAEGIKLFAEQPTGSGNTATFIVHALVDNQKSDPATGAAPFLYGKWCFKWKVS